jgi:hypothetical protein
MKIGPSSSPKATSISSAKNVMGDSAILANFTRRLMSVPHAEIKAKLDLEKAAKWRPTASSSRVRSAPSKARLFPEPFPAASRPR